MKQSIIDKINLFDKKNDLSDVYECWLTSQNNFILVAKRFRENKKVSMPLKATAICSFKTSSWAAALQIYEGIKRGHQCQT